MIFVIYLFSIIYKLHQISANCIGLNISVPFRRTYKLHILLIISKIFLIK